MSVEWRQMVVVDLEATCWKQRKPPPGQESEIIEVGVCLLEREGLVISAKRGLIVKPTRSQVSEFCTKLTSITPEMADAGATFAAACEVLRQDYHSERRPWASWGGYDQRMFKAQCQSFGVVYPFGPHHVDLKGVFAAYRNAGKRVGLMRSMKMLGIDMAGRHHRGEDDAYNTAQVLAHLLREHEGDILEGHWS